MRFDYFAYRLAAFLEKKLLKQVQPLEYWTVHVSLKNQNLLPNAFHEVILTSHPLAQPNFFL
jgi:hypothetical protein